MIRRGRWGSGNERLPRRALIRAIPRPNTLHPCRFREPVRPSRLTPQMDVPPAQSDLASRRALPAMHRLLVSEAATELLVCHPRSVVTAAMRAELALLRETAAPFVAGSFFAAVSRRLERETVPGLRRVLNATGVVLHTNLGRAPLAEAALRAVAEVARGYCDLELDLEGGGRGDRHAACAALVKELTGAEAALVVNNGAAAVLLALSALAAPGQAVVSRGELVEIGGGFRIPDVIRQGGAQLVEVGTTNRTRISDYAAAIGPETRVLLRVHRSNYRILGFTETPEPGTLTALAHERGVLAIEDLGSGAMFDLSRLGLEGEPILAESIAAGFDLVCCSGDKLLGGPQAGMVVGKAKIVAQLARHPLMRALRPDKMTLAALEATLRLYRDPGQLTEQVPAIRMLATPSEVLLVRAERLRATIGEGADVVPGRSLVGGGSLPGEELRTSLVALPAQRVGATALADRLRRGRPPLLGRVQGGRVVLDVRTLSDDEIEEAAQVVRTALRR